MRTITVFTVDDEPHVHAGLDAIIDWAVLGYRHVGSALNGDDALVMIERDRPDVIITDIRMPGMGGLELIGRVREIPSYAPDIIIVSGYDEFEYARKAMRSRVRDYLLKPIDEDDLTTLLVAIRSRRDAESSVPERTPPPADLIAGTLVRRLLSSPPSPELLTAGRNALDLGGLSLFTFALFLPFDDAVENTEFALDTMRDVLSSTSVGKRAAWVYREENGTVGVLLGLDDPATEVALYTKGLYRKLVGHTGSAAKIVVGRPVDTIADVWQSRRDVIDFMSNIYVLDAAGVFVVPQSDDSSARARRVPPDTAGDLVAAVEDGHGDQCEACIESLVALFSTTRVSSRAVADLLDAIRIGLQKLMTELDGDIPAEVALLARVADAAPFSPLPRIERIVRAAVSAALDRVRELRRLGRSGTIQLVKRRIDRLYASDLSLTVLADEYGMNPIYLGQLFKKVLGIGFKEYLRRRRVAAAKKLLTTTDLRIPEVAASVGYRDAEFFVEQFKRETGVTPVAFRGAPES
ncbi:MAG: response regulator [Spirochaetaceae bacterium]|nr:MAG: response regulator [Spirochaetaceae bacterium]